MFCKNYISFFFKICFRPGEKYTHVWNFTYFQLYSYELLPKNLQHWPLGSVFKQFLGLTGHFRYLLKSLHHEIKNLIFFQFFFFFLWRHFASEVPWTFFSSCTHACACVCMHISHKQIYTQAPAILLWKTNVHVERLKSLETFHTTPTTWKSSSKRQRELDWRAVPSLSFELLPWEVRAVYDRGRGVPWELSDLWAGICWLFSMVGSCDSPVVICQLSRAFSAEADRLDTCMLWRFFCLRCCPVSGVGWWALELDP